MISLNAEKLTQLENYKLLTGSIIPRPVALISTQSSEAIVNLAPFSFFNVVSSKPAMVSVSVQRLDGEMKDTAKNLLATKEAVIHLLTEENVEEGNKTAALLPSGKSELDISSFTTVPSETIAPPGINEASVRFETILHHHIPIALGEQVAADFFLLEVLTYHVRADIYEAGKINGQKLAPVSRLAGNQYAKLGAIFELERPTT